MLNCMMHCSQIFSILTFKLLLLEVQTGLVKQIHALCCQCSSDAESTGKSRKQQDFYFLRANHLYEEKEWKYVNTKNLFSGILRISPGLLNRVSVW